MNEIYIWLLAFDIITVTLVMMISWKVLTFFHPLLWYLIWHVISTTNRLVQLANGGPLLYEQSINFTPVTAAEITRAVVWNDIALLLVLVGAVTAHLFRLPTRESRRYLQPTMKTIQKVALFTFPLGLLCFLLLRFLPRSLFDAAGIGSYVIIIGMWPLTLICILIFFRGFRWPLVTLAALILIATSLQGYHRFMAVIPSIFLALVYVMRGTGRYRVLHLLIPGIFVALVMPYMKPMGRAFQAGYYREAFDIFIGALTLSGGQGSPINFLDQFAAALTLIDQSGQFWFGATYFNLLILLIPRALWPGKPSLGQHVVDIATVDRPFDSEGRIITYLGEAYINFAEAGFIIVPFLISYVLTRVYRRFRISPPYSLMRLTYLLLVPASIQMYRDGITSIMLFGIIFNMPLIFIWLLTRRRSRAGPK